MSLAVGFRPFELLATDVNQDGLVDIHVIDHAGGYIETFNQEDPREFASGIKHPEVGFHPGSLLQWPNSSLLIASAEGENVLMVFQARDNEWQAVSRLEQKNPRYATVFTWPDWGPSLAVSPFGEDYVSLIRGYQPATGTMNDRIDVPLGLARPSIRQPERITAADIDGDKVSELLLASKMTKEVLAIHYPQGGQPPVTAVLHQNVFWGMPNEVTVFDLDDDGDNDILLPDEVKPGRINTLINNGHGKFTEGAGLNFLDEKGVLELAVGRDSNGDKLLLAVGYAGISLYKIPANWHEGVEIPSLSVKYENRELSLVAKLQDIDGDGRLDSLVGRSGSDKNLWLVYGPLWEHFDDMAKQNFVLTGLKPKESNTQ